RDGTAAGCASTSNRAKWAYANHGFNVLGYLVETLSGEPYAEHVRSVLFDPLDMQHTDTVRSVRVRDQLATAYVNRRRGLHSPKDTDIELQAAGSVFSTLPDMATYVAALLDGGRGVVAPATLAAAFEPHFRPCATHPGIGLSFFRDELDGRTVVGHSGGVPGFVTACALAPSEGVGVVAFTNGGGQAVAIAAHRTLCALLGVDGGPPRARPLRPDRWRDLIGYYRPDPGPLTNGRTMILGGGVEVAVRDHSLVLRGASPLPGLWKGIPMQPADDDGDVYVVDLQRAGMPSLAIHVERSSDQPVTLHFGGLTIGAFPALHKTSGWKNPRRVAAGVAAGAALTVAGARLRRRS
ncbi:MAG: serine hydrolase domain-containing protein, partial [Acidimicrobiia bacterium]